MLEKGNKRRLLGTRNIQHLAVPINWAPVLFCSPRIQVFNPSHDELLAVQSLECRRLDALVLVPAQLARGLVDAFLESNLAQLAHDLQDVGVLVVENIERSA